MKARVAAVLALAALSAAHAAAAPPVKMDGDADRRILTAFLKHTDGCLARVTPEAVRKIAQGEDICWVWSKYVRMPLTAYRLTGKAAYVEKFVKAMDVLLTRLRKGPDGYLGFRGLPLPLFRDPADPKAEVDVVITAFSVTRVICEFAEILESEPELKRTHGKKLAHYLDIAENHLVAKWDARKQYMDLGRKKPSQNGRVGPRSSEAAVGKAEEGGDSMERIVDRRERGQTPPQPTEASVRFEMVSEGAVYRTGPLGRDTKRNLTQPNNKQSKACGALLALYRVTGKDAYFRKAVALGVRFKHTLRLKDECYRWNYWEPAGEWDRREDDPKRWKHWIGAEHRGGYHGLTLAMAETLYDHGVVFTRTDMQRFVHTQMRIVWNGSFETPVFRRVDGRKPQRGGYQAAALARFEPKIHRFLYQLNGPRERLASRNHSWQGGVVAAGYLAGKYLAPRGGEPTRAEYRDRFAADPANGRWLKAVEFEIPAEPGS